MERYTDACKLLALGAVKLRRDTKLGAARAGASVNIYSIATTFGSNPEPYYEECERIEERPI